MTDIAQTVAKQRDFFRTGATLPVRFRLEALDKLRRAIKQYEPQLLEAMHRDLGKSASEAYMCEVGLTLSEISHVRSHLRRWARPSLRWTPLTNFPALSQVRHDPYGVTLIMSPWNYPVLLTLEPLVGALAAGNCACVKPSAYSPATSEVIARLIAETFPPEYVAVITGGRQENQTLLDQTFDYIFFTGGVNVGRMVMERASRHLTPVTLELGGKSPVIIDRDCHLRLAARRLAFGKWLNVGQTCIAPDYVLCHRDVHAQFVTLLKEEIRKMYGERPLQNKDYGKIINDKHFHRLLGLIDERKVVMGGEYEAATLRLSPTLLDGVTADDAVMQEEIFGPILPILEVSDMEEAFRFIAKRPHPLALYLFSDSVSVQRRFMQGLQFGGGCINDTIMHIASSSMPFGGVGQSGMGGYHGKDSFLTFTHSKSVVKKFKWLDLPLRYQPYAKWKDWVIRMFLGK